MVNITTLPNQAGDNELLQLLQRRRELLQQKVDLRKSRETGIPSEEAAPADEGGIITGLPGRIKERVVSGVEQVGEAISPEGEATPSRRAVQAVTGATEAVLGAPAEIIETPFMAAAEAVSGIQAVAQATGEELAKVAPAPEFIQEAFVGLAEAVDVPKRVEDLEREFNERFPEGTERRENLIDILESTATALEVLPVARQLAAPARQLIGRLRTAPRAEAGLQKAEASIRELQGKAQEAGLSVTQERSEAVFRTFDEASRTRTLSSLENNIEQLSSGVRGVSSAASQERQFGKNVQSLIGEKQKRVDELLKKSDKTIEPEAIIDDFVAEINKESGRARGNEKFIQKLDEIGIRELDELITKDNLQPLSLIRARKIKRDLDAKNAPLYDKLQRTGDILETEKLELQARRKLADIYRRKTRELIDDPEFNKLDDDTSGLIDLQSVTRKELGKALKPKGRIGLLLPTAAGLFIAITEGLGLGAVAGFSIFGASRVLKALQSNLGALSPALKRLKDINAKIEKAKTRQEKAKIALDELRKDIGEEGIQSLRSDFQRISGATAIAQTAREDEIDEN